uniref:Proteasome endopeptidase complex n=1 Tax=Oryza glumipatula TaxID=40148 RepID=A0A0E0BL74_9ORYZ
MEEEVVVHTPNPSGSEDGSGSRDPRHHRQNSPSPPRRSPQWWENPDRSGGSALSPPPDGGRSRRAGVRRRLNYGDGGTPQGALQALGSTAIGLKTKDGVVLAVEKRVTSPLLEPSSVEKIMEIDEHIGCAMSGLIADARTLVEHARVETQNHRFSYGEPMTVESTTQAICDLALRFGEGDEESMSRPFGVSLLIAGHDENGPSLYYTDPSGTFWQCNAKAIGSGSEGADSSLQEQYNKELTLQEAETIALSILKQVMEEKVTPNNVDIAKVSPNYHLYTPAEVEAVIARL